MRDLGSSAPVVPGPSGKRHSPPKTPPPPSDPFGIKLGQSLAGTMFHNNFVGGLANPRKKGK